MAAVLASGPGAMLSHRSAAELWGVQEESTGPISVTVPHETRRQRPGITIHCGTTLAVDDVAEVDGIPSTTLSRTLLDVAGQVDRRTLVRAIGRAEELRQFDLGSIELTIARNRGRRGAGALAAALDEWSEPAVTRSVAEERFLAVVARAKLPTPEVNAWIPIDEGDGYSPDFLWRERGLVVEIDGRSHHARRRAFVHDRRRDRRLAMVGFRTIRYAAGEVTGRPEAVAAELIRLLASTS
jgi:very-short-patch-repair endonuclease